MVLVRLCYQSDLVVLVVLEHLAVLCYRLVLVVLVRRYYQSDLVDLAVLEHLAVLCYQLDLVVLVRLCYQLDLVVPEHLVALLLVVR